MCVRVCVCVRVCECMCTRAYVLRDMQSTGRRAAYYDVDETATSLPTLKGTYKPSFQLGPTINVIIGCISDRKLSQMNGLHALPSRRDNTLINSDDNVLT